MGQEKERIQEREDEELLARRRSGSGCYICGKPSTGRDPKGGGSLSYGDCHGLDPRLSMDGYRRVLVGLVIRPIWRARGRPVWRTLARPWPRRGEPCAE